MEKTKFEIRKSVLAECETICKDPMQCYGIGDGLKISKSSSQYVIEYQDDRGSWWILATINRHTESSASLVLTFYSLLGLDKRDALEAEKEKSKRWESRAWKILQIVRRRETEQRPKTAAVLRTLRDVSEKNEQLVEAAIPVITTMVAVSQEGMPYDQHVDAVVALNKVLESIHEGEPFQDD